MTPIGSYTSYNSFSLRIIIGSNRRAETKQGIEELKEKLLGSDREGLGIRLRLGTRIADLNLTPCISLKCVRLRSH